MIGLHIDMANNLHINIKASKDINFSHYTRKPPQNNILIYSPEKIIKHSCIEESPIMLLK